MNPPTSTCGCCEGIEKLTPLPLANRPGLSALAYRAGTHSTFLETMLARLSNLAIDIPTGDYDSHGQPVTSPIFPLTGLTTRDPSDPAIALLDAWATVADVLTFYQERLANEGYLRTATERRSVLELARLVGYALRPGVASTGYLAYTIEEDRSVTPPKGMEVTIPAGSRAQSVPGPGDLPQPFESADDLHARTAWNKLQPRMSRPQTAESIPVEGLYLKGTTTNLKANDALLIDFGSGAGRFMPLRVVEVIADTEANRTQVTLRSWMSTEQAVAAIIGIAERHRKHPVSPETETAKQTVSILDHLHAEATAPAAVPKGLAEFIARTTLPAFVGLHNKARNAKNLEPWLRMIIDELELALRDLIASGLPSKAEDGGGPSGLPGAAPRPAVTKTVPTANEFLRFLKRAPSVPPQNAARLDRTLRTAFPDGGDIFPRLLTTFRPALSQVLVPALTNATVAKPAEIKVYTFRVTASLFGSNAPRKLKVTTTAPDHGKTTTTTEDGGDPEFGRDSNGKDLENPDILHLDASYDKITPDTFLVVETQDGGVTSEAVTVFKVASVRASGTRAAYGITGKETEIELGPAVEGDTRKIEWFTPDPRHDKPSFDPIRKTAVFAQSELLELAEWPITDPICGAEIELDDLYDGLETGRWVILSGERTDVLDIHGKRVEGIKSAELAMLLSVSHRAAPTSEKDAKPLPGDKTHTFIRLSDPLAYCYRRDKVTIHGNVVKATHGETRQEVLGNGDASKPVQAFALRQPPLTFLPAPTAAGAASTLVLRVNEVEWHETDTLAGLSSDDRKFITKTDDESKTKVIFGNGREGARPPTGTENITAVYRNGIGQPGNVKADQISLLVTRPLGVKEVINPLPATGGADREGRDQARKNAPIGVLALDRLVSVRDYADFTRTFAGIGKASAVKLSDGLREVVHVTIAGANDIPIEAHSDLYRNLVRALRGLGDPHLPIEVELREMRSLIISANVRVLPDYAWELVEPKIRAALLDTFSFERRDLGQDVTTSEVIWAIQRVPGVGYVDLDRLCAVSESSVEAELIKTTINAGKEKPEGTGKTDVAPEFFETLIKGRLCVEHRVVVERARVNDQAKKIAERILPAQIAVLSPALPETLILTEAKA